jgi:hypothetical protein
MVARGLAEELVSEVEAKKESWRPLRGGVFGHDWQRAKSAAEIYVANVEQARSHRFGPSIRSNLPARCLPNLVGDSRAFRYAFPTRARSLCGLVGELRTRTRPSRAEPVRWVS